jgi:hypothetical protein
MVGYERLAKLAQRFFAVYIIYTTVGGFNNLANKKNVSQFGQHSILWE